MKRRRLIIPLLLAAWILGPAGMRSAAVQPAGQQRVEIDYIVDGTLEKDDPAGNRFRTLQAAYAAAPAGTEENPTVIGIRPNVYHLRGGALTPGMRITKDYITLLGLTDDRGTVVLADNRGLQQGADDNGYLLDVDAVGFTCRNLTLINYCNVDYDFPGNPEKNLAKRSDVITQAVALVARGDKHVYDNVALISRLDTMFMMARRAYFKDVHIEGTDDWVGGGGIGYWDNCTLAFPTGNGVMLAMNQVFHRCRFISSGGMQFYKVGFGSHNRPSVLIDCTVPNHTPRNRVAWMREAAPPRPVRYSLTSRIRDADGNITVIYDSSVGDPSFRHSRPLTEEALEAFNPWNLLRAAPGENPDNWDPAGVREQYEESGRGVLVYRVELPDIAPEAGAAAVQNGTCSIRTGGIDATLRAAVTPSYAVDPTLTWSTPSELITLDRTQGPEVTVKGCNTNETPEWVPVHATAANGLRVTAWIYVEPEYLDPPSILSGPTLSAPADGAVNLQYALDLQGREDQSLITWSICDDAAGSRERVIAVSRGHEPLTSLRLTPGCTGRHLKATLEPKHIRCEPGAPQSVIAPDPVRKQEVPDAPVSPNFRHFVVTPEPRFINQLWTVSENWRIESADGLENGYGIHSAGPAGLFYQNDAATGDMRLDLLFRPDKTAGQVFSVPGSPDEEGPDNLHADLYIKYDPRTGNGYSLRFWRTTRSARKCLFQFYRIENGLGTPVDDQQVLSGVFKRDTHMTLKVEGDLLSVTARNTKDNETLQMESRITPNACGGAGMSWSRGTSAICSRFNIFYP